MNKSDQRTFDKHYQRLLQVLKLQGKADKTIDAYSRTLRRVRDYGFLHANVKKTRYPSGLKKIFSYIKYRACPTTR